MFYNIFRVCTVFGKAIYFDIYRPLELHNVSPLIPSSPPKGACSWEFQAGNVSGKVSIITTSVSRSSPSC